METPKRILRIKSHAGHARYLATLEDTDREIARIPEIPSPYAYSPTHVLYQDQLGRDVFIVQTAHKQYDVFLAPEVQS